MRASWLWEWSPARVHAWMLVHQYFWFVRAHDHTHECTSSWMDECTLLCFYTGIYRQEGDSLKSCRTCSDAPADHFYHNILRVQVCKCATHFCPAGCVAVLLKKEMGGENQGAETHPKGNDGNALNVRPRPFGTTAISIPQRKSGERSEK